MADRLVAFLNSLGLQPVLLPSSGLHPPELYSYSRRSGLVRRGPLIDYLVSGSQIPDVTEGALPDVDEQCSSAKGRRSALRFAEGVLAIFGGQGPSLHSAFSGKGKFEFSLREVTYAGLNPSQIEILIREIDLSRLSMKDLKEGNLHVAYQYAYANKLVIRSGSSGRGTGKAAANIGGLVDIRQEGVQTSDKNSELVYNAVDARAVMFAYKAGQLHWNGHSVEFRPEELRRRFWGLSSSDKDNSDDEPEDRLFVPAAGRILPGHTDSYPMP
jgi:hypothetical protein